MKKLAQLKEAEVCGVLSALVDKGLLPVNSPKQFEKVAAYMSNAVEGYDYSLVDLVGAAEDAMKKTASDEKINAKDYNTGLGAGTGIFLGSSLGVSGAHKLMSKGILRSPKSKLLRSLIAAGTGIATGAAGGVLGGVSARKAHEYLTDKVKKAKE